MKISPSVADASKEWRGKEEKRSEEERERFHSDEWRGTILPVHSS